MNTYARIYRENNYIISFGGDGELTVINLISFLKMSRKQIFGVCTKLRKDEWWKKSWGQGIRVIMANSA